MSKLYDNIVKATDNTGDITVEKYATVVTVNDNSTVDVVEKTEDYKHFNVPVINNIDLIVGDTVIIGFVDNSDYNPYVLGVLNRSLGFLKVYEEENCIYYLNGCEMYIELHNTVFIVSTEWYKINDFPFDSSYAPNKKEIILLDDDIFAKIDINGDISIKSSNEIEFELDGSFLYVCKNSIYD